MKEVIQILFPNHLIGKGDVRSKKKIKMEIERGREYTYRGRRNCKEGVERKKTRPDTRLPKSRAGGQGPYLRLPDHLGRSSEVK